MSEGLTLQRFDPSIASVAAVEKPTRTTSGRVATDTIAREVKLSDLADNLANNRALPPTAENVARVARYEGALAVLTSSPRIARRGSANP
jgi:hypothetical protein